MTHVLVPLQIPLSKDQCMSQSECTQGLLGKGRLGEGAAAVVAGEPPWRGSCWKYRKRMGSRVDVVC